MENSKRWATEVICQVRMEAEFQNHFGNKCNKLQSYFCPAGPNRPVFSWYHSLDIALHLWGSYPLFAGSYGCTDLRCGFSEICDTSAKVWPASRTQTDFLNVSYIVWNDSNLSCRAINRENLGLQLHVGWLSYSNRRPDCPKITDSRSS